MKKAEREQLDEFFKSGLMAPEVSEVDEDWERMKSILLRKGKNRVAYYWIGMLSLAALMLIVFSVFFYSADPVQEVENTKANNSKKDEPDLADKANGSSLTIRDSEPDSSERPTNVSVEIQATPEQDRSGSDHLKNVNIPDFEDIPLREFATKQGDTSSGKEVIAAMVSTDPTGVLPAEQTASRIDVANIISDSLVAGKQNTRSENPKPAKNRLFLSFNLGSDRSGVENLNNTTVGYSIGTSLSYNFYKKFSIETGIAYGSKVYETDFSNYKPANPYRFAVRPGKVSADCEILDVQLNLAYNLINKGKNEFGFAAGLSSYFMLQEKYTLSSSSWRVPRRYNIKNQNQYYLGVANLVLSYKRNLTNNTSLSFSPYYKLPLTDIGYGNIRLRSAGLSIGITTNLKKPE